LEKQNELIESVKIILTALKIKPKDESLKNRLHYLKNSHILAFIQAFQPEDFVSLEVAFKNFEFFVLESCILKRTEIYEKFAEYNVEQRTAFFSDFKIVTNNPGFELATKYFRELVVQRPVTFLELVNDILKIINLRLLNQSLLVVETLPNPNFKRFFEDFFFSMVELNFELDDFEAISECFCHYTKTILEAMLLEFPKKRKRKSEEKKRKKRKIERTCPVCNVKELNLKKCGNCLKIYYCSLECQKKDWQRHKIECKNS
jgi:hypothetical protein